MEHILKSDRDIESYFNGIVDYANLSFANIGYDFNGFLKKKNKELLPCRHSKTETGSCTRARSRWTCFSTAM